MDLGGLNNGNARGTLYARIRASGISGSGASLCPPLPRLTELPCMLQCLADLKLAHALALTHALFHTLGTRGARQGIVKAP